jgi:hypothetical protein
MTKEVSFELGRVVSTPGALAECSPEVLIDALQLHCRGDWGDVSAHDSAANDSAIEDGERIMSAYQITPTCRLWIITEADRSVTTFLLPDEY